MFYRYCCFVFFYFCCCIVSGSRKMIFFDRRSQILTVTAKSYFKMKKITLYIDQYRFLKWRKLESTRFNSTQAGLFWNESFRALTGSCLLLGTTTSSVAWHFDRNSSVRSEALTGVSLSNTGELSTARRELRILQISYSNVSAFVFFCNSELPLGGGRT